MDNRDHLNHHSFRDAHTPDGALGVTVKTYLTSKQRADKIAARHKEELLDKKTYNEKTKIKDGNFLRQVRKFDHKN
jgi:ribosomal protein S3